MEYMILTNHLYILNDVKKRKSTAHLHRWHHWNGCKPRYRRPGAIGF